MEAIGVIMVLVIIGGIIYFALRSKKVKAPQKNKGGGFVNERDNKRKH